jgi:hypothetical protein
MPEPDFIAWRKISIPQWQRILRESIRDKDQKREAYAKWLLKEVLEVREIQNR